MHAVTGYKDGMSDHLSDIQTLRENARQHLNSIQPKLG